MAYGDLKLTFIQQCLQQYMQEVKEVMTVTARRMKVGVTDEGINSIAYEALQKDAGGEATLSFNEYLRFVDMGVGRAHPLGGLQAMTVALKAQNKKGIALVKDKVRKPKKFYSKTVYGKLNYLQNKLLHGFTEEAIANLKQQLQDGTGRNIA